VDAVALRKWREDDAPFVCEACQESEIQRWLPLIPRPYTMEHAVGFVRGEVTGPHQFAIVVDGSPVGSVGLNLGDSDVGEAGYWVDASARGRGVAADALRLVCSYGFSELGLARIQLRTDPDNLSSQRVAEKVGFQREGVLRSSLLHPDGRRRDMIMWSLLPEDPAVRSRSDDSTPRG
jgi:RimJ/RimL family protein N-acetyltransferase